MTNSTASTTSVTGTTTRVEIRRHELQAFHRAQHRDRRRDHASQKNSAVPASAQPTSTCGPARHVTELPLREREQREDATLALVVRSHHDHDVFQRDRDRERPEDERQHAENRRRVVRARGLQRFLQRVQRARADVSVDDPMAPTTAEPDLLLSCMAFVHAPGDALRGMLLLLARLRLAAAFRFARDAAFFGSCVPPSSALARQGRFAGQSIVPRHLGEPQRQA